LAVAAGAIAVALTLRAVARPSGPVPVRAAARAVPETGVERGRLVYERYGCALCHGPDGKGAFANPNAETAGKVPGVIYVAEGYTADELRRKLLDGVHTVGKADPNGPAPPYRMPGWAGRIGSQDLADLVEYLMSLYPGSAEEKWR
jgi:mono/diheme cytochrome c family protein